MLNKNNKLKKFISFTLVMAMLICSLFTMSVNAVEAVEREEDIALEELVVIDYHEETNTMLDGSNVMYSKTEYDNGLIAEATFTIIDSSVIDATSRVIESIMNNATDATMDSIIESMIDNTTNSTIATTSAYTDWTYFEGEIKYKENMTSGSVVVTEFKVGGMFEYGDGEVKVKGSYFNWISRRSNWNVEYKGSTSSSGIGFLGFFPWAEIKFEVYGELIGANAWAFTKYPTVHCNKSGEISYELN